MTHAREVRRLPGEQATPEQPTHAHDECCSDGGFTPALPGLAVPPAGTVIRRQKADAETYNNTNGLGLAKVTKETVEAWVNDSGNDDDERRGLLDAWNLNNSARWLIDTPADLAGNDNPFHFENFQEYQDFTTSTTGVSVTAFGGPVSAYYNRGAPKLGSQSKKWGNTDLADDYVSYIAGLRSGGRTDRVIAQALLDLDDSALGSQLEKRAAAMMTVTVYLAEEWRKQGAAKIYRANLRLIAAGTKTFDDFLNTFKFIGSAQDGRKQVGEYYDVHNGDMDVTDMDADDQLIYAAMSPARDEDFSSDDEMRTDDKKNLKGKRLFAEKHKS